MKLNYRDKMILIVVFVLLIIVAGFMLFIKPAIDECSQASSDLESAKVQLSELKDQVDKDKNLAAEIQTLYTSTSQVAANFYDYQVAYKATDKVRELFNVDDVKIKNSNMTISSYGSTVLSPFAYESTATATDFDTKVDEYNNASTTDSSAADANTDENAANTNETAAQTIGYYSLNIQFKSSLSGFKNFADNLTTNNEKSMVIENVNIENVNESEISGSMTLNMYVLKKLADPSAS
ncbi:type II secretion system protein GspM [Ruminococcus bicirculans (ex Wegman et al. 2014)]|uniref:type II secretion system protein GspM n=1 Tax=Ruminococcus bicirculans (ex Wegman et al. 2014) TaxID=1160721 RepID=UPI00242BC15D|nr:type II secretion system protein GspM [Ruminococcus bicirculans (ex Wegman et al. 2014)]MBS6918328.1 type II secretion system protein M [Ruminococcus bicirculans (ex Wegman et al. 2014)]